MYIIYIVYTKFAFSIIIDTEAVQVKRKLCKKKKKNKANKQKTLHFDESKWITRKFILKNINFIIRGGTRSASELITDEEKLHSHIYILVITLPWQREIRL